MLGSKIKLEKELYDRIKRYAEIAGYSSVDEFVTHDILLRNGVVLIEYLCNTGELAQARTFLCALPLKVPKSIRNFEIK